MKNGPADNTFIFFKDVLSEIEAHKKPLTKDAVLNAFLLAANNQSPVTQRKIGHYIKRQPSTFLSQLEKKTVADETLTINDKLTTKASAIAMFYAVGKIALTIVISYILPFIAFSSTYTLAMKLTIIPAAALSAFIVKGYLERSEKNSMEILYNGVDKKWSTLTTNLENFSAKAYKITTSATLKPTPNSTLTQTQNATENSEKILFKFRQKKAKPEASDQALTNAKLKLKQA